MKYTVYLRFVLSTLLVVFTATSFANPLSVANLRCEYKKNPMQVDEVQPVLSWQILSTQRGISQTAYQIFVSTDSLSLVDNMADIWKSGKVVSSASIQVRYKGNALQAGKKYYWKVRVWDNKGNVSSFSDINWWHTGLWSKRDWINADWIGYEILPDSSKIIPAHHGPGPSSLSAGLNTLPMLRKVFSVEKPVMNATMFISGLGHFEMSINGRKTGDHFLDPGWTQYSQHAQYVGFDVTDQLVPGRNAIGVMLGNGFYYIPRERYRKITGAYGYPKMICRLIINYADGTIDNIVSDGSWKAAPSPIIFTSIYGGEDYDANREQPGWNTPSFNDALWKHAVVTAGPQLEAQYQEPVKIMEKLPALKITRVRDDVWVYDIEQNMSGVPEITVSGKKGDTIKIMTAELLNADGTANQQASGEPHFYQYILKGTGSETWHPLFTYYGFRYIQVEKAVPVNERSSSSLPRIVGVQGLHTRNAAEEAGTFNCSNELFNKIHRLIDWAIKSNMASVLTDCPHREKLGWLEEVHLVGNSIKFRYDIAALGRKIVKDMKIAQTPEGLVPDIAPELVKFVGGFRDSPEWGSNCVLLPWYLYKWYGDKEVLQESYEMMKRYVTYLSGKSTNHIVTHGLGDWFDLGPNSPGESQLTPKGVTATAIYYYDLRVLSKAAEVLNKRKDVSLFDKWSREVKAAFNNKYLDSTTKQYASGSQTANAIAVHTGLVNDQDKAAVVANILKDLQQRDNALTTGEIGFRFLLRVLDDENRSDVIFKMNNRSNVPGYGYQLARGATALTESWHALPVVSNNHFMLGHLMEWFYASLAGISAADDAIGYNKIIVRPQVVGDVTYAKATYHSTYGTIVSDWKTGKTFTLNTTIPVNTSASIYLPAKAGSAIIQNGRIVKTWKYEGGKAIIKVGSGKYQFQVK